MSGELDGVREGDADHAGGVLGQHELDSPIAEEEDVVSALRHVQRPPQAGPLRVRHYYWRKRGSAY